MKSSLKKRFSGFLLLTKILLGIFIIVMPTMIWGTVSVQDDKTARRHSNTTRPQGAPEDHVDDEDDAKPQGKKIEIRKQITIQEDTIPDSLLHPRWKIQRTMPITYDDLEQGSTDLNRPENVKQEVVYNDTLDRYVIGSAQRTPRYTRQRARISSALRICTSNLDLLRKSLVLVA